MRWLAVTSVALSVLSSACSVAPPAGPATQPPAAADAALVDTRDARRARGRGRQGGLPPGIAKNLARGKPLPPGIAKQVVPHHVLVQLPPVADGFEYAVVAGKVMLIEIATQVVHDILVDVLLD